jgi:hypothetical protein
MPGAGGYLALYSQGRRGTEGFDRDDDDRWFIANVGVAGSNPVVPTEPLA